MLPVWSAQTPWLCCLNAIHEFSVLPSKVLPSLLSSSQPGLLLASGLPTTFKSLRPDHPGDLMILLLPTRAPAALTGAHLSAAGMYDVFQNTKRSKADRAVEQLAEVEAAARAAQVAAEEAKREAEEKVSSWACRQVLAACRTLLCVGPAA